MRTITSVTPPGPYGTTTFTGRFGQSCASTAVLANKAPVHTIAANVADAAFGLPAMMDVRGNLTSQRSAVVRGKAGVVLGGTR